MELIKNLFDQSKNIYRTIEKVITYNASQENRLKAEISEYVVTDSIEKQFEGLLSKMLEAMENGGQNAVGVWVSGFYGSGKSSFTKYLGHAFDETRIIGGEPFIKHLQDRFQKAQTKALLSTVAKRFPAAIVMLDLASEMLAGSTMEDVSSILFYKALQWAGYSRNLKVAALERRMKKDGRYEEFKQIILKELEMEWLNIQNDPLVVDSYIPEIAHRMYPAIFKTPNSFTTATGDFVQFENDRVREMLDIVREVSGKKYIIFIIDEVGQYVSSRQNLMLNLDGLAKNIKDIGDGKVWLIGTAQQTLTEDDPRAALNSPQLYKLKDRFPIQIDLESSDIREICYRRLLAKSPGGEKTLGALFDQHGQALRHNTKLQDAKYYDSDFKKESFVNLYPFLPAHFDILLHLLGALAKSTGGIGLRSAIKVVQDILIDNMEKNVPLAEKPVGALVTTATLYDALEKDVKRAFPSIYGAAEKALIRFPGSEIHKNIAKTVAVLQIMGNLPVTTANVAALMHPSVDSPNRLDEIKKAVDELKADPIVPFGEQDGVLRFFSEKLNEIESERRLIATRSADIRRSFSEIVKEAFTPLPSANLNGALTVKTGLKLMSGSSMLNLAGENETIQTIIELADPNEYESKKTSAIEESRSKSSQTHIFLLGKNCADIDDKLIDIFRCREICQRHRNDPDQEIKEYCTAQNDRAAQLTGELQALLCKQLSKGSFIFRAQLTAADSLDGNIAEACKKQLSAAAAQVFDKYSEAPHRAETALAEKFLRAGNLSSITSQLDPMGLVKMVSGKPSIDTANKALVSIRDYIERNGTVEGRKLLDHFSDAPFGWSQDTLRYLVAALLIAGDIKLKVSGRDITVNGQQAIDALKTNLSFKPAGVSLRDDRPSNEVLIRAAERLTVLTGDTVLPLEDEITKAAVKRLAHYQTKFAVIGGKLSALGVSGEDKIKSAGREISELLSSDGSDAHKIFGSEESELFDKIIRAVEIEKAFSHGLDKTMEALKAHYEAISAMPDSGRLKKLKDDLAEQFDNLKEQFRSDTFYKSAVELNSTLTSIRSFTAQAAVEMAEMQKTDIRDKIQELAHTLYWDQFTQEEQANAIASLENLVIEAGADLAGIHKLNNHKIFVEERYKEIRQKIISEGKTREILDSKSKEEEKRKEIEKKREKKKTCELNIPSSIKSIEKLNEIISEMETVKKDAQYYGEIEIKFKIEKIKD